MLVGLGSRAPTCRAPCPPPPTACLQPAARHPRPASRARNLRAAPPLQGPYDARTALLLEPTYVSVGMATAKNSPHKRGYTSARRVFSIAAINTSVCGQPRNTERRRGDCIIIWKCGTRGVSRRKARGPPLLKIPQQREVRGQKRWGNPQGFSLNSHINLQQISNQKVQMEIL